jgi:hypothetical protein
MRDARPIARRLLALVQEQLAWLEEDGYAPVKLRELTARFTQYYGGVNGRVAVSVDAARATVEVWLAPPDTADPGAPLDFLRGERVMLEALLYRDGSPVPGGSWRAPEDAERVVTAHLTALRRYRERELAGDWSELGAAREAGKAGRRVAADEVRDPRLRGLLRGHRRSEG